MEVIVMKHGFRKPSSSTMCSRIMSSASIPNTLKGSTNLYNLPSIQRIASSSSLTTMTTSKEDEINTDSVFLPPPTTVATIHDSLTSPPFSKFKTNSISNFSFKNGIGALTNVPCTPTDDGGLLNLGSKISSLALCGDLLLSGSDEGEIKVWTLPTNDNVGSTTVEHCCCKFDAGEGAVKALITVSSGGGQILSAHQDHKIRMWKRSEEEEANVHFKLVATLPTAIDCYYNTLIPPSPRMQRGREQVRRRHINSHPWMEHADTISALAISDTLLYSCSWDRIVKVWCLSNLRCLESFPAHDDAINTLVVSSSDGLLYTGSADTKIKVWSGHRKQNEHSLVATLEGHKSTVNALALTPNGTLLYSGGGDHVIMVWERDGSDMKPGGILKGHTGPILCLDLSAMQGKIILCSGSADNTIRVWRRGATTTTCVAILEGHTAPVKSLCVSITQDGDASTTQVWVYSGSLDGHIKTHKICMR